MTDKIIEDFREVFQLFDRNGDGTIDVKELSVVMKSLGQSPTDQELKDMVNSVDVDASASVDFEEFLQMISKKLASVDVQEEIKDAFREFDRDGNGVISRDELRIAITTMGEKVDEREIDALIQAADVNGDGNINYTEFVRVIHP